MKLIGKQQMSLPWHLQCGVISPKDLAYWIGITKSYSSTFLVIEGARVSVSRDAIFATSNRLLWSKQ